MLRFFRQLRKDQLMPDKARKYILYALGEVLLVVLGILIALQVNNWNENRQAQERRILLLESIQSDYIRNEARLLDAREESFQINSDGLMLMELISGNPESTPFDSLQKYSKGFITVTTFSPLNSSYLTAQSTGDIGLITDKELLELFIEFQEAHDWLNFHVQLSGDMVYAGNISEMREKLGSLNVILRDSDDPDTDPYPVSYRLSEQEFRSFFREKENFASVESMYWINRNVLRSIDNMLSVNEQILAKIDDLLAES